MEEEQKTTPEQQTALLVLTDNFMADYMATMLPIGTTLTTEVAVYVINQLAVLLVHMHETVISALSRGSREQVDTVILTTLTNAISSVSARRKQEELGADA